MRKVFAILLIFTSISAYSQKFTKDDFLEDLEYIKNTLPEKHINIFSKISRNEFYTIINTIKSKADFLNLETFTNELFKLTVAIDDEHTIIEPLHQIIVPIKFEMFTEGIFVTEIDSEYSNFLLREVVAINERPINDVVNDFKKIIQSHNKSYFDVFLLLYLNNATVLKGLGTLNVENEITYTLRSESGNTSTVRFDITNVNKKMVKAVVNPQKTGNNYYYKYDSVRNEIYFNYSKCRNDESYPFANFNADLFKFIDKAKPEKIILDLRYNSGGNSTILNPFFKKIKRSYLNKPGKFYVLIGKETFSSALLNAVELKRKYKTILVGEQTAGSINHYGEILNFQLPKTKIKVIYSTKYYEIWKGNNGALNPDIKINYSIENFKQNRDEAIEYINTN